ncbi:MAG: hypothetical protein JF887_10075 [Candidatus Dormibacteraeota bacterium]|uniref:Uncharacterized protein n=1 Tax=Candidatus Amunia macphersoniae TaxID=3127014 RepID=A0A934NGU9_9BACT|nr:hypothetical protein [Candidatus Dormibacteraeota bacterium]
MDAERGRPVGGDSPSATDASTERHHLDPAALSVLATTASGALGSPGIESSETARSRPWSMAAAMEPVPPLAPPPALPGQGLAVTTSPRKVDTTPGPRTVVSVAVLVVALAVIVVLVLVLGH